TREERKLEAIMRAFEQMEKSEKKKQQAREKISQQKVQKHQTGHDGVQLVEEEKLQKSEEDGNTLEGESTKKTQLNGDLMSSEEGKLPSQSQSSQHTPYHKRGKKRRASGSASRRRTRTNSGSSEILSPDEGSLDHFQSSASMQQLAFDLAGSDRREGFIFPKSKR
ncbi:SET domain-containing protein 5-like, partial [Limulus polyphemus]|uniref:SET domain-containing protein 5-like n=1 Tax=Limulus polyphemus TaxID=6850 RepID=A0ABM1C3H9_LIMPO